MSLKSSPATASPASAVGIVSAPNRRLGLVLVHITAFLAGFTGLFSKWLDVGPPIITLGRTLVGSVALLIFARWTRTSLRIPGGHSLVLLVSCGAMLTVHWLSFFQSIQVSTVAIGLLAFSTYPLFVTFLEPLFFRERLHLYDLWIALLVVAGLAVISPGFDVASRVTQGVLWGVLAAFSCAILSLLSRSCVAVQPPVAVVFYQQVFGALFASPALLFFHGPLSTRSIWLIVLLGIVFTALSQVLMVSSLRHIRAQVVSVIIALEPVYGILFAALLLHEIPTMRTLLGGALICGAVFWASWTHARPTPSAQPM